ncbi:Domain of unknown function (DUF4033) [Ancistrocladus abbreviatus]
MDAELLLPSKSPLAIRTRRKCLGKQVVRLPSSNASLSGRPADHGVTQTTDMTSTVYHDNWFDRLAINHFSNSIQAVTVLELVLWCGFAVEMPF